MHGSCCLQDDAGTPGCPGRPGPLSGGQRGLHVLGTPPPTGSACSFATLRLRGGGGDGGSTGAESRSSYLEMYKTKSDEKVLFGVDPAQQRHARWTRCAYSGEPFQEPIVADEGGNLFNKAALLEGLAGKAMGRPWPESLAHIRLKELLPVRPKQSSTYNEVAEAGGARPSSSAPFDCPLTEAPLNGRGRAYLHRPTGALVSEKGLSASAALARAHFAECAEALLQRGVGDASTLGAVVAGGGTWSAGDLLIVNPEGEDLEAALDRVMFLRDQKRKRRKGQSAEGVNAADAKRKVQEFGVGGKRAKASVLGSLFHEDGQGAKVVETFCCRSIGARGLNLS